MQAKRNNKGGDKGQGKKPRGGFAVLLGLAATLLVVAGHWAGMDRWLELGSLDARFRWLATAPSADEIVNVDIDDRSLDELGRWPWPREQLAGVVEVLCRCGAKSVAMDIILPYPQETRYESAGAGIYKDTGEVVGQEQPRAVFDDQVLVQTIEKEANRVLLPMYVKMGGEQDPASALKAFLADLMVQRPGLSLAEAREAVDARGGEPTDLARKDGEALPRAYLYARAMEALRPLGLAPSAVGAYPVPTGAIVPPLVRFVKAIRRTGFVTFDPDSDGVVRLIPMLAEGAGRVYPQFALSLAAEELGQRHGGSFTLSADAGGVTIACADGFRREIPVDGKGNMLINWMAGDRDAWGNSHVPAFMAGRIHVFDWKLRDRSLFRRLRCFDLMKLYGNSDFRTPELEKLYYGLVTAYSRHDELYYARIARQGDMQKVSLFEPGRAAGDANTGLAEETALEAQIDAAVPVLVAELRDPAHLAQYLSRPADASSRPAASAAAPASAPVAGTPERMDDLADRRTKAVAILAALDQMHEEEAELVANRQRDEARLRVLVGGKICLLGSTATGAADFVPTPMQKRMPGVMVHANIVNTILSGRFVRPAHWAADLVAILLCGTAVSLVAARRPVWQSGPIAALLAAAYAAVAALVVFHLWDIWLAMVAPLVAMLLAFLVVTAYRQLTEERAKRQIRGLFAHALSPELVDRLTEDPSLLKLGGERRPLSCFFSDLQDFTPLSEKLKEQKTGRLLNRYFDRVTAPVQQHQGGYVNKLMGDGMFAFFGAPVFQNDHAARAVRAAVDYVVEVDALNPQLSEEFGEPIHLFCRIGIATGEVMVGNYGSTDKFDYTAIGETVNLASRLEGANKFFGTHILVDDSTWKGAGDGEIVARCMGRILVVGSSEPVTVWNPMGWRKDLSPKLAEAAEGFTRAIELYVRREFPAAAELLEGFLKVFAGDKAAGVYLNLCRNAVPAPGDEWDGILRLTQK